MLYSDWWFFSNGYILNYGDAQAHLNISRSIIDSRTPSYGQIGNVWLPVLHVICLPFVAAHLAMVVGPGGHHSGIALLVVAAACPVPYRAQRLWNVDWPPR